MASYFSKFLDLFEPTDRWTTRIIKRELTRALVERYQMHIVVTFPDEDIDQMVRDYKCSKDNYFWITNVLYYTSISYTGPQKYRISIAKTLEGAVHNEQYYNCEIATEDEPSILSPDS